MYISSFDDVYSPHERMEVFSGEFPGITDFSGVSIITPNTPHWTKLVSHIDTYNSRGWNRPIYAEIDLETTLEWITINEVAHIKNEIITINTTYSDGSWRNSTITIETHYDDNGAFIDKQANGNFVGYDNSLISPDYEGTTVITFSPLGFKKTYIESATKGTLPEKNPFEIIFCCDHIIKYFLYEQTGVLWFLNP